jgi:hypothetical protein
MARRPTANPLAMPSPAMGEAGRDRARLENPVNTTIMASCTPRSRSRR